MRWCAILAAACSLAALVVRGEDSAVESRLIPEEIAADLKALSAPEFAAREAAGHRLVSRGREVVGPLTDLAGKGSGEAAVRAFDLLRQLSREDNEATLEAVETAFEALAESDNPTVTSRAEAAIEAGSVSRHARAVAAFQKLGGILRFRAPEEVEKVEDEGQIRPIEYAMLGADWTGGDEGLKQLKRIEDFRIQSEFRGAALFVIKGCKVSPEALADLEASLPSLLIQRRGPACLGVSPYTVFGVREGLPIGTVKAGSAADRAGLRPGDLLLKFNDFPVDNFEALVDRISERQPGDKVPVVYERNGVQDTVTVELRSWD